jgi:hypothetical protein
MRHLKAASTFYATGAIVETLSCLAIALLNPGSGYGIILTSLLQFQAQGWEKWLSRITFTRGTNSLKSNPISINSYPALTLLSPESAYGCMLTKL